MIRGVRAVERNGFPGQGFGAIKVAKGLLHTGLPIRLVRLIPGLRRTLLHRLSNALPVSGLGQRIE